MYLYYLVVSAILIIIIYSIQNRNFFNPLVVYIILWLFIVSLYILRLIPYEQTTVKTWFIIIFVPIAIWFGYSTIHFAYQKKSYKYNIEYDDYKKLFNIKFFLYIFGFLLVFRMVSVWLGIFLHYGSFLAAFTHGDEIYNLSRKGEWAPGIGFYIPVDYISMFLAGIYHKIKGKIDSLLIILILANLLMHIGLQSRFALIMTFSLYFASYMGANKGKFKIKFVKLITFFIIFGSIIFIISYSRNLAMTNHISGKWGNYELTILPSIYFYLTNGIAGLNEYLKLGVDEYNMLYTFDPLLRLYSVFDSSIHVHIYETVTYYTPIPTIISTWLKFLIDDFGILGAFIVLYLYGVILKFSELKLKSKLSIFYISIYAHIFATFICSFFGYSFFIASFWYSLVITSLIGLLIDTKIIYPLLLKYRKVF